jgi:DNA-binding NarL/FixJ family response regulator
MSGHDTIRVLCVDDHGFLIQGLQARLAVEPDMEFVGALPSATNLLDHIKRTGADIVMLDIDMPGRDVFEAIDDLRRRLPEVRSILLSAHVRDQYIDAAYRAGAWGYLTKGDPTDIVIEAIRKVYAGEPAFSDEVLARSQPAANHRGRQAAAPTSKLGLLTGREMQVLGLIARGLSRQAIADQLCRSPNTVDNHRKSIMKKLGIHDRVALARYAIQEGLG